MPADLPSPKRFKGQFLVSWPGTWPCVHFFRGDFFSDVGAGLESAEEGFVGEGCLLGVGVLEGEGLGVDALPRRLAEL